MKIMLSQSMLFDAGEHILRNRVGHHSSDSRPMRNPNEPRRPNVLIYSSMSKPQKLLTSTTSLLLRANDTNLKYCSAAGRVV